VGEQRRRKRLMLAEKKPLSLEELEAQAAIELPERELPALIKIVLLNGDVIPIRVRLRDVNVILNLCAVLVGVGVIQRCQQRG
jgi:hypothetical protein